MKPKPVAAATNPGADRSLSRRTRRRKGKGRGDSRDSKRSSQRSGSGGSRRSNRSNRSTGSQRDKSKSPRTKSPRGRDQNKKDKKERSPGRSPKPGTRTKSPRRTQQPKAKAAVIWPGCPGGPPPALPMPKPQRQTSSECGSNQPATKTFANRVFRSGSNEPALKSLPTVAVVTSKTLTHRTIRFNTKDVQYIEVEVEGMRPYQYIVEDRTLKSVTTFPSTIVQKKACLAARRRAQRLLAEVMAEGNPVATVKCENPKWILDSGSSFHILGRDDFERLPPSMRKIRKRKCHRPCIPEEVP